MKVKLINDVYKDYYLENYVKNYGIYDLGEYLNPPIRHLQNPSFLDNIQEGYNLIKDKNKIHIIVDSDCDGMTSASILYLYLKDWKPNIDITYTLHTGK